MVKHMDVILWTCEHERWAHEHEVSPSESCQEYPTNIDEIFFDAWDEIFDDVEECFAMCHGWMIFLDDK